MNKQNHLSVNRVVFYGVVLNLLLTFLKLISGIAGKSSAILADAFHSLSDLFTDFLLLWGVKAAAKPVDSSHDYGHGKFESLVTLIISVILFLAGGQIFLSGLANILKVRAGQDLGQPGIVPLYVAIGSILTKEILYHYTVRVGRKLNSQAIIANAIHHRSDAFSSIAAGLGIAGAIFLGKNFRILDPIAALIVSVFIVKFGVTIFMNTANELVEGSLSQSLKEKILAVIINTPDVNYPHNLKTRRIGRNISIEVHIKVDKDLDIIQAHDISTSVERRLKDAFGEESFVSIHVEPLI